MNTTILLFDIDSTLFDTDCYNKKITQFICDYFHLDKSSVILFEKQYRENIKSVIGINIKDYSEQLGKEFSLPHERILNLIMENQNLYVHSMYSDILAALTQLSKHYTLGIFSQGYVSFQMNKLTKMGILPFFDKKYIYIFPYKIHKNNIEQLPKNSVIIDNKLSVVETVAPYLPAILINRGKTIQSYKPSIKKLTEIIDILSS